MDKKRKPIRYRVVCWSYVGNAEGVVCYVPKWVCSWPKNSHEFGARFELTPTANEAKEFGRDQALDIAQTIRMRNGTWAMVERA